MPEIGQDRPAQDTDVATAALEAKMVRNHRFSLIRSLIGPAHVPELGQDRPARGGGGARGEGGKGAQQRRKEGLTGVSLDMASLLKLIRAHH